MSVIWDPDAEPDAGEEKAVDWDEAVCQKQLPIRMRAADSSVRM